MLKFVPNAKRCFQVFDVQFANFQDHLNSFKMDAQDVVIKPDQPPWEEVKRSPLKEREPQIPNDQVKKQIIH